MKTKTGNKNETDFSAMGPTIFESWVIKTELWVMEIANPNSPLIFLKFCKHEEYNKNMQFDC